MVSILKIAISISFILWLAGCGLGSQTDKQMNIEHAPYKKIAQASVKSNAPVQPLIDFSWIEKAFKGILVGAAYPLGTSIETILFNEGSPAETGSYEGGDFYDFKKVTYFTNPLNGEVSAIARNISHLKLTVVDVKKALGNPDREELNEMDGNWMMEYTVGDNRLVFEFTDNEEVQFVWLHHTNIQE